MLLFCTIQKIATYFVVVSPVGKYEAFCNLIIFNSFHSLTVHISMHGECRCGIDVGQDHFIISSVRVVVGRHKSFADFNHGQRTCLISGIGSRATKHINKTLNNMWILIGRRKEGQKRALCPFNSSVSSVSSPPYLTFFNA